MSVFGCVAYAIMSDVQRGKLNAKDTKCLFLGYCEGTKACRRLCLRTKKVIKSRDVVFVEDGTSVGNALEIRQSGRNEGPTVVVVEEFAKSSSCDDGEERKEQVGDHLIANEEAIKIPVGNDSRVERFGKDRRYSKRE